MVQTVDELDALITLFLDELGRCRGDEAVGNARKILLGEVVILVQVNGN